ncbi:MAG: CoA ester lyase [Epsilonproteobacteria bacterium]|nr:CoA ester lyase [Campylobacterota bacterium]
MLQNIKDAYEKKDISFLNSLCEPTFREINTTQNYRSILMVSAHKIKHLLKIPSLKAEAIILNLEDGVSKEEKPFALVLTAFILSKLPKCDKKLIVRVNSLDTTGYDEIAYLNQYMPDAIRVPKIRTKEEVESVLALLHEDIELHLSIETKEAWHNLKELKVHKRVKAFYLGILDLFADMKLPQSLIEPKNPTLQYILSEFLITTKAMDVKPVGFVYQDYKNEEGFLEWLELEKQMGYTAKGCLSPSQVEMVHQVYGIDPYEIQKAKEIVRVFEKESQNGVSGFVHKEYGFIDEPIYKGALALLEGVK